VVANSLGRVLIRLPLASLLATIAAAQGSATTREYRYLMGTSVEVEASGGDLTLRRAAIDEAFAAIAEVDRLMSNYRNDSELSRVNRQADREAVPVSDPMLAVLQAASEVSARSGGTFDVTISPAVALWGFYTKKPHLPSAAELAAVRPLVDFHNLDINAEQHTVRFKRPGMMIDLGGIAKGFAVEVAANVLRRNGLSGVVDAGGNQYLLGAPTGKARWTVGVKHPDVQGRLLGVIETAETSVSTSAEYASFVAINGRAYGHILDPRTLYPSTGALSVTVLSHDGTLADAVSTAAFILGPTAGLALIDSFPGMSGLIAYRQADGRVGIVMSSRLKGAFYPSPR
jgi:FAD:protein FMN transferase